ncbi:chalcone isomerase family protein [Colwellia sp. E2M01]|uniref:chalcone isomerase family protein n=1 Tax=Colwellia sp. E2M01 TaxID=2841561 RepID=UPI001C08B449|nr:chalcone isomerase family protein [Colwellia sp. E2M01]MBU2872117.1 chalcone isomerase family protein [Colwellia sp. E2M01]
MSKFVISILLCLGLISFNVFGKDESQTYLQKLPDEFAQLNVKEVGSAKFSVLFWDIYNSTLYTPTGEYSYTEKANKLIFKIEYLKDISSADLIERTVEQWQHLNIPKAQYSAFIPRLQAIWPDISAGDSLAMLVENNTAIFYFNNDQIGMVEQPEFYQLFLDIWLSPKTSQAKLRSQLLGEA